MTHARLTPEVEYTRSGKGRKYDKVEQLFEDISSGMKTGMVMKLSLIPLPPDKMAAK